MPEVEIPLRFKKRLAQKSTESQGAILRTVQQLADHGTRYPGLHCHPVRGYRGVWEAYVNEGDRVTFNMAGGRITMRVHCNHDVLRSP